MSWVSSKEAGVRETALLQVVTLHISEICVNIEDGQNTNICFSATVTIFST